MKKFDQNIETIKNQKGKSPSFNPLNKTEQTPLDTEANSLSSAMKNLRLKGSVKDKEKFIILRNIAYESIMGEKITSVHEYLNPGQANTSIAKKTLEDLNQELDIEDLHPEELPLFKRRKQVNHQFNKRDQSLNDVTSKLQATLEGIEQDKKAVTNLINTIKQNINYSRSYFSLLKEQDNLHSTMNMERDEVQDTNRKYLNRLEKCDAFIKNKIVYGPLKYLVPIELEDKICEYDKKFEELHLIHDEEYGNALEALAEKTNNRAYCITIEDTFFIRNNSYDLGYKEIKKHNPGQYAYESDKNSKEAVEDYNELLTKYYKKMRRLYMIQEMIETHKDTIKKILTSIMRNGMLCYTSLDNMQSKLEQGFNLFNAGRHLNTTENIAHQLDEYNKKHESLFKEYNGIANEANYFTECIKEQTGIEGRTLHGQHIIVDKSPFGAGGYGTVYQAKNNILDYTFAIKKIPLSNVTQRKIEKIKHEYDILKTLEKHPGIPQIYDYYVEENNLCIVMDHFKGPTLKDYQAQFPAGKLPLHEVIDFGIQLCDILEHLHNQNLIFRDLKPANIIRNPDGHFKLVDFGIAHYLEPDQMKTSMSLDFPDQFEASLALGSLGYAAPEVSDLKSKKELTYAIDIYSLGATLHHLLSGQHPWNGYFTYFSPLDLTPYGDAGLKVTNLIEEMIATNKTRRPRIQNISKRLQSLKHDIPQRQDNTQAMTSNVIDTSNYCEKQHDYSEMDSEQQYTLEILKAKTD